jgi:hypothetical protein
MHIRRLTADDAEALKLLRIDAATTSPRAIYPTPAEVHAQSLQSFRDDILSTVSFGAFVDGALIGFVGLLRISRHRDRLFHGERDRLAGTC